MAKAAMLLCGVVGVVLLAGVTEAESVCPKFVCAPFPYLDHCRAPFYLVWYGNLCKMCDLCIQSPLVNDIKCPPQPCPMIADPPQFIGKKYFMWRGQMCPCKEQE